MAAAEILRQIESLKAEKIKIEQQISSLESQLHQLNPHINNLKPNEVANSNSFHAPLVSDLDYDFGHGLSPDMIYRYSRQLILPSFGVQGNAALRFSFDFLHGKFICLCFNSLSFHFFLLATAQSKLLKSSVLVIGAGGLGSPALLYLAACGIGEIGV